MSHEAYILGTGSYLPERVMTNADLEKMVDTTNDWIVTRTGIRERRIAGDEETASSLGIRAARKALEDAGVSADQIGLILVTTSTPDMIFPSTGCLIQEELGAKDAFCMDLSAACSGFLFGLDVARQYIASGNVDYALVIGAEKMSCILDWQDRTTCILFGDGAGAAVIGRKESGGKILNIELGSNGALGDLLKVPAGGSSQPASEETIKRRDHAIRMSGREVFKHAVVGMSEASRHVLEKAGKTADNVACIVPHQANRRIVSAIGKQLGVDESRFFINLDKYGNTSAASIIIAMDEARKEGKIKPGDLVLLVVFGGGFTWGAGLVEWSS